MEKPLERHLEEVMNSPGVTGVICADSQGLCLGAKGVAKRETAGLVSAMEQQARKLNKSSEHGPVINIETDNGLYSVSAKNTQQYLNLLDSNISQDELGTTDTRKYNYKSP